ncbi:helix-turn-helix domain-containing protein [Flavobacteriaceae bacterium R38]|nr:helix-turn-helix domain-containing protein [Flavobacteriaceae bacterium R38]
MIDSKNFAIRLQKIIDHYELSASAFAEKIEVQRSSISHLLSGRNKPSLDFTLKVIDTFPEVNFYWLLKGEGTFPSQKNEGDKNQNVSHQENDKTISDSNMLSKKRSQIKKTTLDSSIDRIIIFYKDGRFDEYQN